MGVFFLFLLATAAGCLSTLYWIREDDLGRGYFQMNALIVLCLLGLAVAVWALHPFQPFGGSPAAGNAALLTSLAGAFAYYALVWRERWRPARWAVTAALAGSGAALLIAGPQLARLDPPLPYRDLLLAAGLASSALLLGWSLVTMLLGHWYLIAPRLSFRHLMLFCQVLLAVVLVRAAIVAAGMGAAAVAEPGAGPDPWRHLAGFEGEGMFFWFRLLWGLAIPLTLAVMALHCARRGSNQSATGILYVLVVGTFIGEITALYVSLATGVPV